MYLIMFFVWIPSILYLGLTGQSEYLLLVTAACAYLDHAVPEAVEEFKGQVEEHLGIIFGIDETPSLLLWVYEGKGVGRK
jgi:hypothetical protein